jgi:hypothetical protein
MNLVNQREKLKEIHKAGLLHTSFLHEALNAPVFVWSIGDRTKFTEQEKSFVNEFIATGDSLVPNISPYNCFRISMEVGFIQWFFSPDKDKWFMLGVDYRNSVGSNPELWTMNIYPSMAGAQCEYRVFADGRCVSEKLNGPDGKVRPDVSKMMHSYVSWLCLFLCDLDMPGNVVLKVSPPSQGKTVEWRLAREHYLIINKKQASLCRDRKSGPSNSQIIRSAHARIAHFRVLKSPVFKHKHGQKIRVKEAWVGPDEWIGLDKKIYKVMHRK